jgi:hypothetical protein
VINHPLRPGLTTDLDPGWGRPQRRSRNNWQVDLFNDEEGQAPRADRATIIVLYLYSQRLAEVNQSAAGENAASRATLAFQVDPERVSPGDHELPGQ